MKKNQFTKEQLLVINDTHLLEGVYNSLLELSANTEISLQRKRVVMFGELINFIRLRKGDFLLVGIKPILADKLIKSEIKTLEEITKELKNVIS